MERLLLILLISALLPLSSVFHPQPQRVLAETSATEEVLITSQPIKTESEFKTKLETEIETIEKDKIEKENPEQEIGTEEVLDEGRDGKIIRVIEITFYQNQEYSREIISSEKEEAKPKIISKGTKIIWRTLQTENGEISYWRKLRVYATHYDSHCLGCNETTAIGMRAGKGVIAVDPKVIKLRSKVYIPGYGLAVAGDTGGAIKGNIIDLGFEDARTAGWSARFVDIYLL